METIYLYIDLEHADGNTIFSIDGIWRIEDNKFMYYQIHKDPILKKKFILRYEDEENFKSPDELMEYYGSTILHNVTPLAINNFENCLFLLGRKLNNLFKPKVFGFDEFHDFVKNFHNIEHKFKTRKHAPVIDPDDIKYTEDQMHKYLWETDSDYRYFLKWENGY